MGNKSSKQKREKKIRAVAKALQMHPAMVRANARAWGHIRDLTSAGQPRATTGRGANAKFAPFTGLKEKNPLPRGETRILYRSGLGVPKRKTRAVLPEVNKQPQPWEREASRKKRRAERKPKAWNRSHARR